MRFLLLLAISAVAASAQPVSFGVKAGVPLTDIGNTPGIISTSPYDYAFYFSRTHPYVIGATVEFRLPRRLAIEVDGLYRHLDYTDVCACLGVFSEQLTPAGVWEFPTLLKFRFPTRIVRPFVAAGISWEFLNAGYGQNVPPPPSGGILTRDQSLYAGFVAGAGIDVHVLFLHLSPEIRFTRWGGHDFLASTGGCSPGGLCTSSSGPELPVNHNQAEFLLGITF